MFCAFAGFGAMPLLGYAIFPWAIPSLSSGSLFAIACANTGVTLFLLGAYKVSPDALIVGLLSANLLSILFCSRLLSAKPTGSSQEWRL
jgi:hypothetical protein